MATVTTPSGEVLTNVSATALDYYRGLANTGENYRIDEDAVEASSLPSITYADGAQSVPPAEVEQLPEGQAFQTDDTVHVSDGASPLPAATGQVVDTATGLPVDGASLDLSAATGESTPL